MTASELEALAERVGEELPERLRTAFRRSGGLPRLIRAPEGRERIIALVVAEVRATIQRSQG